MSCLLCGGPTEPWLEMPLDAKKLTPTPYGDAVRCPRCDLGAIAPMPAPDEIAAFYDLGAYYTHGASHFADGGAPNFFDKLRTHFAWRLDKGEEPDAARFLAMAGGAGALVCDIGCGDGALLADFRDLGAEAVGVDPDARAVARLREMGFEVHQGTGEAVPDSVARGAFDLVVMSHSLEHCIDPVEACRSSHALLKPGGLFVCETPNAACNHFRRFSVISEMYDAPRHLYFFSPRALKATLKKAGFKIEGDYYRGFTRYLQNDWRATENRIRDALVKAGADDIPPPHSRVQSWMLLAQSALAPPSRKYDCVGVYGRS